jgi:sulfur-oxidizing protein SoxZ
MSIAIGDPRVLLPAQITKDAVIYVRALITHPMATGLARDADGHPIKPHFINDVVIRYGDADVAHFTWTSGISKDPYIAFPLRATHEAPLTITWKDNEAGVFHQTVDVRFTA